MPTKPYCGLSSSPQTESHSNRVSQETRFNAEFFTQTSWKEAGFACPGTANVIVLRALPLAEEELQTYEVLNALGLSVVYSEVDLDPVIDFSDTKPSTKLAGREFNHLAQFSKPRIFSHSLYSELSPRR